MVVSCGTSLLEEQEVADLPYYNEATFTPHWFTPDSAALDTFHRIPPFQLIDQEGEVITRATFAGRVYVADFFFTICPGICPKMTDNMKSLQDTFLHDEGVLLLSHSVMPERDSVAVLKRYAESKGVLSHKWHLVTGNRRMIYHLGRQAYFVEESLGLAAVEDEFLHTENFVLVDGRGFIRGIYNGLNHASVLRLIEDIRILRGVE